MLDVAVAGLLAATLAAAAAPDTSLRLPGTALRFGMSQAQVERVVRAQPAPAAPSPAPSTPGAPPSVHVRFFGLDGEARLEFEDGVLARAAFRVAHPSPHDIDYVEDDLARQGFRRRCEMREGLNRRCVWTARARVQLSTSPMSLEAYIEPVAATTTIPAATPIAATPPPAVENPVAIPRPLPATAAPAETLQLSFRDPGVPAQTTSASPWPDSLPWPQVLVACHAVRPEIARQSGVFGRVMVEALVDSSGYVAAARVVRGVPMLDAAALECARQYRFAPYRWRGLVHPFRVALPIRFTL